MSKRIDLTGKTFNMLTALNFSHKNASGGAVWECKCLCGNTTYVRAGFLKTGITKSCGCMKKIWIGETSRRHGKTKTSEYQSWTCMKRRGSKKYPFAHNYADRGITICDRWRNSFEDFLSDMGPKPTPKHTLDRINTDGNYEPGNCRWATMKEQCNNKRDSMVYTHNSETKSLLDWCEQMKIPPGTVYARIHMGWDVIRAFTTPRLRPHFKRTTVKTDDRKQRTRI